MSLNVLIVDDSAVMRAMVTKTLRMADVDIGDIHEAANGQEGLDALREHWVDLVIVDINMPVMNGEEMINVVREDPAWQELPIVVISTEGSQTRIERMERKGAKFVHKPFTPEVVREVIAELTGVTNET